MRKIILILCAFLLVGCASGKSNSYLEESESFTNEVSFDKSYVSGESFDSVFNEGNYNPTTNQTTNQMERKLIKNYTYSLETEKYDETIAAIKASIMNYNGYIQNCDSDGGSYYSQIKRSAYFTIRIPVTKAMDFNQDLNQIGDSVITNYSENVDDVTSSYFDVEAHINNLKIEEETLQKLMAKADTMADIITIEARISELRYEIEKYETQIRNYDTLINYATFNITIREVHKVEYQEQTLGEKISEEFERSIESISEILSNLVIFFIGDIIYVAILALIILAIIKFIKKQYSSAKKVVKKEEKIVDKSE